MNFNLKGLKRANCSSFFEYFWIKGVSSFVHWEINLNGDQPATGVFKIFPGGRILLCQCDKAQLE